MILELSSSHLDLMLNITKGRMNQMIVRNKPAIQRIMKKPPKISNYVSLNE